MADYNGRMADYNGRMAVIFGGAGFDDVLKCVPDRPVERVDPRVRKGGAVLKHFSRLRSAAAAKALVAGRTGAAPATNK
eukprot:1136863-Pyramimonas_sp.AAC.2